MSAPNQPLRKKKVSYRISPSLYLVGMGKWNYVEGMRICCPAIARSASARCAAVRRVPASPQDDVSPFDRSFITLVLCTRLFPCLSTLRIIYSCSSPVAGIFLEIVKLLWLLEFKYFPQVNFFLLLCSWLFCHKVCLVFFETESHSIA